LLKPIKSSGYANPRIAEDGLDLFEAPLARSGQRLANSLKSCRFILLGSTMYGKRRSQIEKSG
jgi:hypothetical protein